jgi:hypothetical protein
VKRLFLFLFILTACGGSGSQAESQGIPVQTQSEVLNFPADSSLVTLTSSYQDTLPPHELKKIQGSGFIVQLENRRFVLTASHVSQGQNLTIKLGDRTLQILGRLYDGLSDFEMIEVEGGIPTSFQMNDQDITWVGSPDIYGKWIDQWNFVPMNKWVVDPNLSQDNTFQKTREHEIFCDSFCDTLNSLTLMQPGSSGSPLIQFFPAESEFQKEYLPIDAREGYWGTKFGTYRLRGVTIRRERFYSRSSFVSYPKIQGIIEAYLQGQRTQPARLESKWELKGSVLARLSGSVSETMALGGSSGNGISMDGGDLGKIQEENPKSIFDQITAYPGSEQGAFFWVMMMRHPTTSKLINFPTWFDMEQYNRMKRWVMALSPDPEDVHNILNILTARFGRPGPPARMVDPSGELVMKYVPGEVSFEIQASPSDKIQFKINRTGYVCQEICNSRFDPVVEVRSQIGQAYLVDLRGLFFVDSSHNRSKVFRHTSMQTISDADYEKLVFDELDKEGQRFRLSIRKKRPEGAAPMTVQEGLPKQFEWTL